MYEVLTNPEQLLVMSADNAIRSLVTAIKEYKIAETQEETVRTMYREQRKIEIAKIEETAKIIITKSNNNKEVALSIVAQLGHILKDAEDVNGLTFELCKALIDTILTLCN